MKKALNEKTNDNSVFHVWTYWMNKERDTIATAKVGT